MGLKAIIKQNKWIYAAAKCLRALPYPFLRGYMKICRGMRGIDGKKVYFSSFGGKLYNENPKYVCEALMKACPEAKIIFRLNRAGMAQELPEEIIKVPQNSPAALFHMATAKVIVKNAALRPWMAKSKEQVYIQLWHGDRGLKKILLDKDPAANVPDRKLMDIGVSASEMGTQCYMRRGFGFGGEVLECGYPKNDILVNPPAGLEANIRRELGLEGKKILLYAPTFRDKTSGSAQQANFSLGRLKKTLEEATGEEWEVLTRGHTLNTGVKADAGRDVSAYPDVSELLLATDMLVTDYSSICGDYMILERPIILYHADRGQYDRELIFDPEKSPYRIAHNEEELTGIAARFGDAAENCRALAGFYGMRESGRASEIVAGRIKEIIEG